LTTAATLCARRCRKLRFCLEVPPPIKIKERHIANNY
jgi:hypothetical protein